MDWVGCKVELGGDKSNVLVRGEFNPVSWPEVLVLQHLHGEESVYDVDFIRAEPSSANAEKLRLISIYGVEPIEEVYPGRRPSMDGKFPGDRTPPSERKPVPKKNLPPMRSVPRVDAEV